MTEKLLICIGAQKAGTTWLHDYLSSHPQVHPAPRKEVHYFTCQSDPHGRSEMALRLGQHDNLKKFLAENYGPRPLYERRFAVRKVMKRMYDAFPDDHEPYLKFLRYGQRPGKHVIMDFSPSYSTLSRKDFSAMASCHPDVRFVYLMRDPIDRIWSQIRMEETLAKRFGTLPPDAPVRLDRMRERMTIVVEGRDEGAMLRSNYARTLTELEAVIPQERILTLFYETLFTPEAVRRVTDFIGIDLHEARFDKRVHTSEVVGLDPALHEAASRAFSDIYAWAEKRFAAKLPPQWSHASVVAHEGSVG